MANPFIQNPFDKLADDLNGEANAPLPGQRAAAPMQQAPDVTRASTPAAETPSAAPATTPATESTPEPETRRPTKVSNWLPPADMQRSFDAAAQKHNVPVNVLMALGHQESNYQAARIGDIATKYGRAKGLMQYLDSTAKVMGINPFNADQSIDAAAIQIRERLDKGYTMSDAVMEHFAGPDRKQWKEKTAKYGRDVMGKATTIGNLMTGGAAGPAAQPAKTATDTAIPADWKPLTEAQAAEIETKQGKKPVDEFTALAAQQQADGATFGAGASDVGKNLKIGLNSAAQDLRELVGRIPLVGQPFVKGMDAIDQYATGKTSDQLLAGDTEAMKKTLTPQMQGALEKKWWDSEKSAFGPAWSDWRSYSGGLTQSLPAQALTMVPAMRLAKYAYAGKIAAGATVEVASAAAARTAMIAGGISEGLLGGASSAREVRNAVNELKPEILAQSDAYKSLLSSGMTPDAARTALAEDLSTGAFVTSGIITGVFGGLGDRTIAKLFTERVGGSVVKNTLKNLVKGGIAEGVLEELPQSLGQAVSQNVAIGVADPTRKIGDDVINQGLGGMAIGTLQGSAMGAASGGRRTTPPTPQPGPTPTPGPAPGPTPQPAPAPVPPTQAQPAPADAAPPAPPTGKPLGNSVTNAAEAPKRVILTAEDGEIAGTLQAYQEDGNGGYIAQVVGDDGQVYEITDQDGVQITPVAPAPGPLTGAIEQAAEEVAAQPEIPVLNDVLVSGEDYNSIPVLNDVIEPVAPEAINEVSPIVEQADQPPAAAAPTPATEAQPKETKNPYLTQQFPDQGKADAFIAKNGISDGYEVAQTGKGRFQIKPIPEKSVAELLKSATRKTSWGQADDPVAQDILKSKSFPDLERALSQSGIKVTGVLGSGASSIVLNGGNTAIRLGTGDLSAIPRIKGMIQPISSGEIGGIRYEVMPKADTTGITDADVATVAAQLKEQGYEFSDAGTDNLGRVNGNLVVIDPGAVSKVTKKPIAAGVKPSLTTEAVATPAIVGDAGGGIVDGMYNMLWAKVEKGDTTEAGGQSMVLQAAKGVRDNGGLKTKAEFRDFAQKVTKAADGKAGEARNKAIRDVMTGFVPVKPAISEAAPAISEAPAAASEAATDTAPAPTPAAISTPAPRPAAPAPASKPAPTKKLTGKAKIADTERRLAEHFTPGNVIKSYSGNDRVISYTPSDAKGDGFAVRVQAVVQQDGQWVPAKNERERSHSTRPSDAEMKNGVVERAAPAKVPELAPNTMQYQYGGSTLTANLSKPAHELTLEQFAVEIKAQGLVGWKDGNLKALNERHFQSVKAAIDSGKSVPDEVLAGYTGLVRPDLTGSESDLMADDLAGVSGAERVKAMRAWQPAIKVTATPSKAEPASTPPPAGLFDGNKLFTADKVAAARARMKSKLNQLNSGLDPELVVDGMTLAGAYIEAGTRKFSAYANAMVDDFGPKIAPYLLSFYEAVRHYPGLDTDGMSTPETAKKQHDAMLMDQPEAEAEPAAPAAAPVAATETPADDGELFTKTKTVSTPSGREFEVRHKIVEAADLTTSNRDDGSINPDFPQDLQPRDRTRQASQGQVNDIAAKLNPRLLGESASATDGAPIVSDAGIVESGNGRTMAIRRAYERNLPGAAKYRAWLASQGYEVDGMTAPVLVRERVTPMTNAELRAYTQESNDRTTLDLSPTERAMSDAEKIGPIMSTYIGGEIDLAGNRPFIRAFVQDVAAASDRGGLMDANGMLSQGGKRRIEAAMLAAAYDDAAVVADLFESTDSDIKSIGGALLDVSGDWAKMRDESRSGAISSGIDVTKNLIEAVNVVRRARAEGRPVLEFVNQDDIFSGGMDPLTKDFLSVFYRGDSMNRPRSRDRVAEALRFYSTQARQSKPGTNLFGDPEQSGADLMKATNDRTKAQDGQANQQQDIFASPRPDDQDAGQPGAAGSGSRTGAQDQTTPEGEVNVPGTDASVERDSAVTGAVAAVGDAVSDESGAVDGSNAGNGGNTGSTGRGRKNDPIVPVDGPVVVGERGNQQFPGGKRGAEPTQFTAGINDGERSGDAGIAGVPPESIPAAQVRATAATGVSDAEKRSEQRAADKVASKPGIENIRATLPYLMPAQQDDVLKAETRLAKPDGYGILFTNGTGTGKTFTALGVIKRHARDGKTNILIVVPDDKIAADWIESGRALDLDITALRDTKDAGKGITITSYANLGANDALASRKWDLVVPDESHMLMQDKDGTPTSYLHNLRAITNHPDGAYTRFAMLNRADLAMTKQLSEELGFLETDISAPDTMAERRADLEAQRDTKRKVLDKLNAKLQAARDANKAAVEAAQGAGRTRAVFLSATPFAYEKTIDWANGYLFDYNDGRTSDTNEFRGYNQGSNREQFFMQHLGYQMRTGKLSAPSDPKLDRGVLQRQFNGMLKKAGSLSGRMLDVPFDYDRRFISVDSAIGTRIDDALDWLSQNARGKDSEGMQVLEAHIADKFDYLSRRYLLEAIKAAESVPIVRQHLALGRKVVVFHDYKKGGGFNPFNVNAVSASAGQQEIAGKINKAVAQFRAEFKDLVSMPFQEMKSPIETFSKEFPDVLLVNGDEKKADLLKRYKSFQDDANGPQVMLVQSAKNKGWSGHDTTGKHQRVLINLGMPTQSTTSIQQEGRIYRTGQASDAIIRLLNTGTNWEKWAFATTIAGRASTAENLGMGEASRALKDSYIAAFEESDTYPPGHEGEGKGGKERDKASNEAITEYDRAKAFYRATTKKNAKTKAQEGADYYATPEPVGLKMVHWLDSRGGEDTMEPSGGHGAIARWLPENTNRTVIEPSMALRSRMAMVLNGESIKIVDGQFEEMYVGTKFDGIAMNPPFNKPNGSGGKLAIEHLAKAAQHLRNGGRVVAIIPTGPSADKHFNRWFNESVERPLKPLYTHPTMGPVYRGDTITTNVDWAKTGTVAKISAEGGIEMKIAGSIGNTRVNLLNLRSVQPTGPRTETFNPAADLHLIADIKMPSVTFERAGTKVATRIVVIEKQSDAKLAPTRATISRDLTDIDSINELFERMENMDLPARTKPVEAVAPAPAARAPSGRTPARPSSATPSGPAPTEIVRGDDPIVSVFTKAGKELRGVIRPDLTPAQAKAIDPHTWVPMLNGKRAAGPFIRERYLVDPAPKFSVAGNAQTDTPAFKRWFGDSQVVDAAGDPMVVYHGTGASFDQFKMQDGMLGRGAYFTDSAEIAGKYADGAASPSMDYDFDSGEITLGDPGSSNVMPVYLKMKRPYTVISNTIPKDLIQQGYDGIIHKVGRESNFVVFSKEQIKSATGNDGSFDIESPDIRFSAAAGAAIALTPATLRTTVTSGPLGPVVTSLIESGAIVLHADASTLPRNVGAKASGIQAVTMPDGSIHLVASGLSANSATPVLLHEAFHQGAEKLIGTPAWDGLMNRLGSLYRQAEQSSGKAKVFFDRARKRVSAARARGAVTPQMEVEEFAAYAVEEYESAPPTVRKWVSDLIGQVRAWALKRFGAQLGAVTPGQLSALAKMALQDVAAARRGDVAGQASSMFSVAGKTTSAAFKRWFGDSSVVNAEGDPLVVYHGASSDFSEFSTSGETKGSMGESVGFYFTDMASAAGEYGDAGIVMPVYLSIKNPLRLNSTMINREEIGDQIGVDLSLVYGAPDRAEPYWFFKNGGAYDGRDSARVGDAVMGAALSKGFDGAIFKERMGGKTVDVYLAFSPEQIKSATGNDGSFDPSNPDIRFSVRPEDSFTDLTDPQKDFLRKIGPVSVKTKLAERWRQLTDNLALRARQAGVDRYAALFENDKALYGADTLEGSIASSSWVLARMSASAAGAVTALLDTGRIYLDKTQKVIDILPGTQGLSATLRTLGSPAEIDRFMGWIAANRARKLLGEGRENLFTEAEIVAAIKLSSGRLGNGKSRGIAYAKAWKEFQQIRDDVLGIAEQAGIITPIQRETWSEEFYVPFYRVLDQENEGVSMSFGGSSGLSRQQAYKKLKGGKQHLNDLLENTLLNFHHLLQASLKNQAALQAVENALNLGMAAPTTEMKRDKKASTFVMDGGEKRWYNINDPLTFKALSALMDGGLNNPLMKAGRAFKRFYTNMTTATPQFIVANALRDTLSAMATSPTSPVPFKTALSGVKTYLTGDNKARMMASGAAFSFGHVYGSTPDDVKASMSGQMRANGVALNPMLVPNAVAATWRGWKRVTDVSENANRAGIWQRNMHKGKLKAAFESRDLMDFSAHGDNILIRAITDLVPFVNARIQGQDKLYRSGIKPGVKVLTGKGTKADRQAFARFAIVAGALSMVSMALFLNNYDDEEYRKLEDWQRDSYWVVRVGENMFFMPKPFEVGSIATLAERTLEQFIDPTVGGTKFASRMKHMLSETFGLNAIPQIVKPLYELSTNTNSFTGRQIEQPGMKRLSPSLRSTPSTTRLAEGASLAMESTLRVAGMDQSALSPLQIDHLIAGYTGQIGSSSVAILDTMWRSMRGEQSPDKKWIEYQPIKRFYKDLSIEDNYTRYGTDFYNALEKSSRAYANVQHMQKMGELERAQEDIKRDNTLLSNRGMLTQVNGHLSKINAMMKQIQRDTSMDGADKRKRLDDLRAMRNQATKQVVQIMEANRMKPD